MQPKRKSAIFAALSAAAFFFAAAPAQAQGLVSIGSGSYTSPNAGTTSHFSYYLSDRGNGMARGYALWVFPDSAIVVRVTSFGFFELTPGTTSLGFAGPIVAVFGTPSGPNAVVGRTAFTGFNDNGFHAADETVGFSVAPLLSQLPPPLVNLLGEQLGDLTTIQQISALLPFFPPAVWAPLMRGNIWIR